MLRKKTVRVFGRNEFLLGKTKEGTYYYLEQPNWDCGWYWGGLYLEAFTNNRQPERSRDIQHHTHLDSQILNKSCGGYEAFREMFPETTLNNDEIWRLLELGRTFYTLRHSANLFHMGSSWVSKNDCYDTIKDDSLYERIVREMIPAVISSILNLLGGNTTPEQFSNQVRIEN